MARIFFQQTNYKINTIYYEPFMNYSLKYLTHTRMKKNHNCIYKTVCVSLFLLIHNRSHNTKISKNNTLIFLKIIVIDILIQILNTSTNTFCVRNIYFMFAYCFRYCWQIYNQDKIMLFFFNPTNKKNRSINTCWLK